MPRRASGASTLHRSRARPEAGVADSEALQRVAVHFTGADAHDALQVPDEDLAVANLAGTAGLHDRLDHGIGLLIGDGDFQLDLRQEIHDVLGAAIQLGVALLATEALDLGDGDAGHARIR